MDIITQRTASTARPILTSSNQIGRSSSTGFNLQNRNTSNDRLSNNTVQPIRIIKPTLPSSSTGSSSEDVSSAGTSASSLSSSPVMPTNLSPPVITNMNEFKTFLNFYNQQTVNNNSNNNNNNTNQNINNVNDSNSINNINTNNSSIKPIINYQNELLKQNSLIKLGDFILFEQQSSTDSLNSAFNTKSREYFYWKV